MRPPLDVLIVGEDRVCYSAKLPDGNSYRKLMTEKVKVDEKRVHFTGPLPYGLYKQVLQASSAHVYLTWPFVLSWSLVEAMSVAAPLVTSDVPPVREALGESGGARLVEHYDVDALTAAIEEVLDNPDAARARGLKARARVAEAYDRAWIWPARADFLRRLAEGEPR